MASDRLNWVIFWAAPSTTEHFGGMHMSPGMTDGAIQSCERMALLMELSRGYALVMERRVMALAGQPLTNMPQSDICDDWSMEDN